MSQFNNDAVEKFLKQVKTANDFNSQEIRIPVRDAEALALGITLLLSNQLSVTQRIVELQDQLIRALEARPTNIDLNGGSF